MPLYILGAGGHGKVVADVADSMGLSEIAFLDDRFPSLQQVGRFPVVGRLNDSSYTNRFCAVGLNASRSRIFNDLELWDSPILTHPSAIISPSSTLSGGTVLAPGVIVNADTVVGHGVILNTGCSIDHDCVLDDFVHISPGARLAGGVTIGVRSWVGIGAVVREGITIGSDALIAAGAAVVTNIPDGARVGGVPAKQF